MKRLFSVGLVLFLVSTSFVFSQEQRERKRGFYIDIGFGLGGISYFGGDTKIIADRFNETADTHITIDLSLLTIGWALTKNVYLVGTRVGGSMKFYAPSRDYFGNSGLYPNKSGSFNGAIQAAFQPIDFFAIQTELLFSKDHTSFSETGYIQDSSGKYYRAKITETFDMNILTIPILAKFTYRPRNFYIAGLAGIYFNVPLGYAELGLSMTLLDYNATDSISERFSFHTYPGFMVGSIFGIKLGSGVIFADIRYGIDFNDTKIEFDQRTVSVYKRSVLHISLGYEIGLIKK
jgi:hypothetical protein